MHARVRLEVPCGALEHAGDVVVRSAESATCGRPRMSTSSDPMVCRFDVGNAIVDDDDYDMITAGAIYSLWNAAWPAKPPREAYRSLRPSNGCWDVISMVNDLRHALS